MLHEQGAVLGCCRPLHARPRTAQAATCWLWLGGLVSRRRLGRRHSSSTAQHACTQPTAPTVKRVLHKQKEHGLEHVAHGIALRAWCVILADHGGSWKGTSTGRLACGFAWCTSTARAPRTARPSPTQQRCLRPPVPSILTKMNVKASNVAENVEKPCVRSGARRRRSERASACKASCSIAPKHMQAAVQLIASMLAYVPGL